MKITVTEHGHQLLRTLSNQGSDDKQTAEEELKGAQLATIKTKKKLTDSMALPTISIEVKTPKIKISEPFKLKYDYANSPISHIEDTSDTFVYASINTLGRNRSLSKSKKYSMSDITMLNKMELKFRKIKQKHDYEKQKAEQIIKNIRLKVESKASKMDEQKKMKLPSDETEDDLMHKTNYMNRRLMRIQMIHKLKYKSDEGTADQNMRRIKYNQLKEESKMLATVNE